MSAQIPEDVPGKDKEYKSVDEPGGEFDGIADGGHQGIVRLLPDDEE
jgi:hypothetical protein